MLNIHPKTPIKVLLSDEVLKSKVFSGIYDIVLSAQNQLKAQITVDTCTGDLGAPAYRKWDLEAWMPGRNGGEFGEVTSTSNCTDYQARRLNIKYKDDDGKNKYVHTLNGTAIAVGRAMLAILENYQNADGSVTIPEVLVPYCGFDKILPKNK